MNILVISENFYGGGWDKTSTQYIKALSDLGDVTYFCSASTKNRNSNELAYVKCLAIPFSTKESVYQSSRRSRGIVALSLRLFCLVDIFWYAKGVLNSLEILQKKRYQFCYIVNGGHPGSTFCLSFLAACKFTNTKSTIVILSTPRAYGKSVWKLIVNKISWFSSDKIITNAAKAREILNKECGAPLSKIMTIYNGIPDSSRGQAYSKNKAVENGKIKVGIISRIDVEKGCHILVDAFLLLCEYIENCELHIYGDGPHLSCLKKLISKSCYSSQIFLHGSYTGDVSEVLHTLDVYAFPSLWEGFPYSLLEAMRSGCGIVSTDVGGIPEILRDNHNAILVKPNCIYSLARALEKLIENDVLRRRLGEQARKDYKRKFTESRMLQSIKNFHLNRIESKTTKMYY